MDNANYKTAGTFAVLIFISFLLITYQIRIRIFAPAFRKVLFSYMTPVEKTLTYIPGLIDNLYNDYRYMLYQKDKLELLQKENHYLRNIINDLYAYKNEFIRLEKLMGLKRHENIIYKAVRIIGTSGFGNNRDFIIDVGKHQSAREYDVLISDEGFFGYIIEVYDRTSLVRTALSNKTSIAVYLDIDGTNGIYKGNGSLISNINYVPQSVKVSLPQRVYTSGLDGVFPRNLYIGDIIKLEKDPSQFFYDVYIELNSSPLRTKYLYLLKKRGSNYCK